MYIQGMEISRIKFAARDHANDERHHTAYAVGKGWVCEQCDSDFAEEIASWNATITHFKGDA